MRRFFKISAAMECGEDMSGWLKGVRRMDVMIVEGGTDKGININ